MITKYVDTGSHNYAIAIYNVAKRSGKIEIFIKETNLLKQVFKNNKKLIAYLQNFHYQKKSKHELIDKIFKDKFSSIIKNLFHVLIKNNRVELIEEIFSEFDQLYEKELNIYDCILQSAHPLEDEEKEEITIRFEKRFKCKLNFSYQVYPDLIGGFLFKLGDILVDKTIRGGLEKISKNLKYNLNKNFIQLEPLS